MNRKLVVEFTKMHGAGNDFIVIDNRFYNFSDEELSALARKHCPRRFGIGADGLMAFATPLDAQNLYRMRYVNADGTFGTMCGNGARCLARFAQMAGFDQKVLHFETDAGIFQAVMDDDPAGNILLWVPSPKRWQPDLMLRTPVPADLGPWHFIWTGTEHLCGMVADVEAVDVNHWGPTIRHDIALAPTGANVNFMQLLAAGSPTEAAVVKARTYEKGVEAETLACGTGALAIALTGRLLGILNTNTIQVQMPGGMLEVGFDLDNGDVKNLYLKGPAEVVYRGTIEW